jgi:hypothetical protein
MLDDASAYCVFFASVTAEFLIETGGKSLPQDAAKALIEQGISADVLAESKITNPEHIELIVKALQTPAATANTPKYKGQNITSMGTPLTPKELAIKVLAYEIAKKINGKVGPYLNARQHVNELEEQHEEAMGHVMSANESVNSRDGGGLAFTFSDTEVHIDYESGRAQKSLGELQRINLETGGFGFDADRNQLATGLEFNDRDQFAICAIAVGEELQTMLEVHRLFMEGVKGEQVTIAGKIQNLLREKEELETNKSPTEECLRKLKEKQSKAIKKEVTDAFVLWLNRLLISLVPLIAVAKNKEVFDDAVTALLPTAKEDYELDSDPDLQQLRNLCDRFIQWCDGSNLFINVIRNFAQYRSQIEVSLASKKAAFTDMCKWAKIANDLAPKIGAAVAEKGRIAGEVKALDADLEELSKNNSATFKLEPTWNRIDAVFDSMCHNITDF